MTRGMIIPFVPRAPRNVPVYVLFAGYAGGALDLSCHHQGYVYMVLRCSCRQSRRRLRRLEVVKFFVFLARDMIPGV